MAKTICKDKWISGNDEFTVSRVGKSRRKFLIEKKDGEWFRENFLKIRTSSLMTMKSSTDTYKGREVIFFKDKKVEDIKEWLDDIAKPRTTFEMVALLLSYVNEMPIDEIKANSHTIEDLGIDSLDFLDFVFEADKEFGIKIPLESWTDDVNLGMSSSDEYFVVENLCARIDELIEAKETTK